MQFALDSSEKPYLLVFRLFKNTIKGVNLGFLYGYAFSFIIS
jgi:hypothetical protein